MKLATFEYRAQQQIGLVVGDNNLVLPLQAAESKLLGTKTLPNTMNELLEMADEGMATIDAILQKPYLTQCLPLSTVKLLAPIPRPRKNIFCVGKNYAEHAKEVANLGVDIPLDPIIFTKPPTAVVGPGATVKNYRGVIDKIDYEAELAVIIGKTATQIDKENAYDYVFGYTALNDVSARDLQAKHHQWFLGKSPDTFCPMGPWIVSKSEMGDINNIYVRSKINGELRQNGNTGKFIFDIPTLLATITATVTLEPGDIIATGTPAGVGMGFKPPKLLKPGDVMEIEIENIGVLLNQIEK